MLHEEILGESYKDWDNKIVKKNVRFLSIIEFIILMKQLHSMETKNGLLDQSPEYLQEKFEKFFGKKIYNLVNDKGLYSMNQKATKFIVDHFTIWGCNKAYIGVIYNLVNINLSQPLEDIYNDAIRILMSEEDLILDGYSTAHELIVKKMIIPYLANNRAFNFFKNNTFEQNYKDAPPYNIIVV